MLGVFSRLWRTRKKPTKPRARLSFEMLETRLCPAGEVLSFQAEVLAGHSVHLSGSVTGTDKAGVVINFSGAVNASTTTDANGLFAFTTSTATLGTVQAVGTTVMNYTTNSVADQVEVNAPMLHLSILNITTDTITLFAGVEGLDAGNQTLDLGGVLTGSQTTGAQGHVIFTSSLSEAGYVEVSTADLWGQTASTALFISPLESVSSQISLDISVQASRTVVLTGTLTGDDVAGQLVTFTGAVTGSTRSDADGNYTFTTQAATLGDVTATWDGGSVQDTATIAVAAPVVNLQVVDSTHDTVTLYGTVEGIDVAGRVVTFSGVSSGTVVTSASGTFILTTSVSGQGTIEASTTDLWAQISSTAQVSVSPPAAVSAPQITLEATVLPDQEVQLTGRVLGAAVAGVVVTFSGAVSGTTTTDSNGYYSYTTTSASLGYVYAVGVDAQQQSTNFAAAVVALAPPRLSLAISSTTSSTVTFTGKLTGTDVAGQTISLGGSGAGTVVTDSAGNFTFTKPRSTVGTLTAAFTDSWSQVSNVAAVNMPEHPPVIRGFTATNPIGNTYVFRGRVLGESVAGLTVTLGGILNTTATVQADGTFYRVVTLTDHGTATAQVTDSFGRTSDVVPYVVCL